MLVFRKQLYVTSCLSLVTLALQFVNSSCQEHSKNKEMISRKLMHEINVHGFLLWVSMGFLMPVGILFIRMSNKKVSARKQKLFFHLHITSQIVAVVLATAGAVMSIKNFNNFFNNHHQRIGAGLYGAIWVQLLIGLLRPPRGSRWRLTWFVTHWLLGTSVALLGTINTYTGLQAYTHKTSRSTEIWQVLFTVEVSCTALLYLLQEKWSYIRKKQGASAPTVEPIGRIEVTREKTSSLKSAEEC